MLKSLKSLFYEKFFSSDSLSLYLRKLRVVKYKESPFTITLTVIFHCESSWRLRGRDETKEAGKKLIRLQFSELEFLASSSRPLNVTERMGNREPELHPENLVYCRGRVHLVNIFLFSSLVFMVTTPKKEKINDYKAV